MVEITIEDHGFNKLRDKVILITGGSSGIGLTTALLAEQHGAKVVVGDINPLPAETDIEGKNLVYLPLDVTSWTSQSSFFKKAHELHGRVDHVFASAGVAPQVSFLDEHFDEAGELKQPDYHVIDINLKGVIDTVFLALHYIKKQSSGGSIVAASSIAGLVPFPELDYSISKNGVIGLTRSLDYKLSRSLPHIRCNAVAPSWTVSSMVPAVLADLGGIVQEPSVVARSVALLLSDETRRGQTLLSYGGKVVEMGQVMYSAVERTAPEILGPGGVGVLEKITDWAAHEKERKEKEESEK